MRRSLGGSLRGSRSESLRESLQLGRPNGGDNFVNPELVLVHDDTQRQPPESKKDETLCSESKPAEYEPVV